MKDPRAALSRWAGSLPPVFWWLWSGALVTSLATFVFPFLALYLTSRGFDARRTGLFVALAGAGGILAGPLGGSIADRFGRRPAILGSLLGTAAAAAFLGFAETPALVAPGVLAFGLCATMTFPAINATIADLVPAAQTQRAFGLLYWATNLGVGLSALVGGALAARGYLLPFLLDAGTTLLCVAILWRRVPESRPAPEAGARRGWGVLLRDPALAGFLAVQTVAMLVFFQFQLALPIALLRDGLGAPLFGKLLALNCGLVLLFQPWASRAGGRLGATAALAISALLFAAGFGGYALCHTPARYAAATLVWTFGELLGLPAAVALVARLAPRDLRGRYQGAYGLCIAVGMTLAPLAGGAIIEAAGLRALWLACLGAGAAAALGQVVLGRRRARGALSPRASAPPAAPPS